MLPIPSNYQKEHQQNPYSSERLPQSIAIPPCSAGDMPLAIEKNEVVENLTSISPLYMKTELLNLVSK